jgi:hypothetical protein
MEDDILEELGNRKVEGKIVLQNKNYSLVYYAYASPKGLKILLKLFNEIAHKPVSRMSYLVLNEEELEELIATIESLKDKIGKANVSDNM